MKRTHRCAAALAAVVSLALALPACGGEPADQVPVGAPPLETPEPPPVEPFLEDTSGAAPPVTLEAVNESGVEGRATAIHMDDSVQVNLMVQGLPAAGEYAAHIHRGTCETGGQVVVSLSAVRAESDGMGRSSTTIAAARLSADERHFVQVHDARGAIACGDVHGHGRESGAP